jgi:hypothetical protein
MGHGGRTAEHLEMEAAKEVNYTMVVVEIDPCVDRIESLCSVYFQRYYLMLQHCHLGVVVLSHTGHSVEPYWLSSVEIHLSTSYVNKTWS